MKASASLELFVTFALIALLIAITILISYHRRSAIPRATALALLPAAMLLGSLGCGGGGGNGGRDTVATPTPTPTVSVSPTPSPSSSPTLSPTVSLSASGDNLLRGQSVTLQWSSQNATVVDSSNFGASVVIGSATVTPTVTTTYTITLRDSSGKTAVGSVTVHVADVAVAVTPTSTAVDVSQQVTLGAQVSGAVDTGVTWTVDEAGGGTVTAGGVYSAPAVAGTYHIRATSVADTRKAAVCEVSVRAASGAITVN